MQTVWANWALCADTASFLASGALVSAQRTVPTGPAPGKHARHWVSPAFPGDDTPPRVQPQVLCGTPWEGLCRLEPGPQTSLWVSSLCCPESQLHVSLWAEPGGTSEPIPKLGVLGTSHSSYPTSPVPSSCSSESFLRDTCPAVLSAAYPLLASGLCEVAPVPLCSPLPPACLSCRRCDIRVPCLPATFAPQVQGPLLHAQHPAWQTVGQTIVLQHTEPLGLISNPQRLLLPFLKVSRSHSF